MTSDSIPFILYAVGATLITLVLIIARSDHDTDRDFSPSARKRRPAYQASRLKRGTGRNSQRLSHQYRPQRPRLDRDAFGLLTWPSTRLSYAASRQRRRAAAASSPQAAGAAWRNY